MPPSQASFTQWYFGIVFSITVAGAVCELMGQAAKKTRRQDPSHALPV